MAEKKGNKKKQVGDSGNSNYNNNSSFTNDLFGPKDPPSPNSSSTLFGSVFGPPSSTRKQDFGGHYGNAKHGIPGNNTYRGKGENSGSTTNDQKYQSQTVEPSYLSSSIYYGAQEVYSPTSQTNASQPVFKRDGKDDNDDDPNGSDSTSRGNWWKGSLYY